MYELEILINYIIERPQNASGCYAILQDGKGQRLSCGALHTRFDKASKSADVDFQFRDIRAKTATGTEDLARTQQLLGYKTRAMTEHYTRHEKGERVEPLK